MKTVYCLRIRMEDMERWSQPDYFRTRKERDDCERINRILGGIRTHSFEEKKTEAEIEDLEFS